MIGTELREQFDTVFPYVVGLAIVVWAIYMVFAWACETWLKKTLKVWSPTPRSGGWRSGAMEPPRLTAGNDGREVKDG